MEFKVSENIFKGLNFNLKNEENVYKDLEDRKKEIDYIRQEEIILELLKPYNLISDTNDIIAIHYFNEPMYEGRMYQFDFKNYKKSYAFYVRIKWDNTIDSINNLKKFIDNNPNKFFEKINFDDDGYPKIYNRQGEISLHFYYKWMERLLKISNII